MNSIIQTEHNCFLCGRADWLEKHHIFGASNRKNSEKYGLTVYLCHWCHNEPPDGVHFNAENMLALRKWAQKQAMENYGWDEAEFIKIFGRSYL